MPSIMDIDTKQMTRNTVQQIQIGQALSMIGQGVDADGLAPLFVLRTRGFNLGHNNSFK